MDMTEIKKVLQDTRLQVVAIDREAEARKTVIAQKTSDLLLSLGKRSLL